MSWAMDQRQNFITEKVTTTGTINRKDLMDKFGISVAQASYDLRDFMAAKPNTIRYNKSAKLYELVDF